MSETLSSGLRFLVFAVVTLLATALLATTIGNYSFTKTQGYSAVFTDAVNLVHGDEVRMAGVRVGSISGVKLVDGDKALVKFSVDKDVSLTSTTLAVIRYRNLIGQRYLALVDGPSGGSALSAGATIPLERTSPALNLNALFNGFQPLLTALSPADVNKLSYELIQVLQGEGPAVDDLFQQVGSLTNTLADRDKLIGDVIDNLDAVLGPLNARDQNLSALIGNLQRMISGFADDRTAIGDSLTSINRVSDSTAQLLAQGRPALKNDIGQLATLTTKLDEPGSRQLIQHFLDYEPFKLQVASAITGYGAFQLFYLCSANFILPDGTQTQPFFNKAKRCTNP
jgi:phospholipid/cholesterol/gamma-HCH transport system substrate-binding protein